jgi:hypothetical protein
VSCERKKINFDMFVVIGLDMMVSGIFCGVFVARTNYLCA